MPDDKPLTEAELDRLSSYIPEARRFGLSVVHSPNEADELIAMARRAIVLEERVRELESMLRLANNVLDEKCPGWAPKEKP